jgi:hypothetical protein
MLRTKDIRLPLLYGGLADSLLTWRWIIIMNERAESIHRTDEGESR